MPIAAYLVEDDKADKTQLRPSTGPGWEKLEKYAKREKVCPHCQAVNDFNATICRSCHQRI